jgi:glyoxylase-like metal-dependent hydrolase (beta-lactamase superfamily II)
MRIGDAVMRPVVEQEAVLFPPQMCFSDYTAEDLQPHAHWLCPHHVDSASGWVKMSHHAWLIEINGKRILVDPCVGNGRSRPEMPFYDRLETPWLERLAVLGATPESIDYVFCTHLHVDHVGWNTRLVDGRMVPTFPNARYLIPRVENAFWSLDLEGKLPGFEVFNTGIYAECVLPVIEAGQADLVGEGHRIAECISLIDAPGHTIGHMAGVLESAGEGAVLCGDAIHHPLEVLYPHRHTVQHDAVRNEASVRMLLDLCAAKDYWLAPQHFMAPHICKVRKQGGAYQMEWPHESA